MTELEAIAACRARWTHAPLDPRDVEERIALRLVERDVTPQIRVLATPPACRIFVVRSEGRGGSRSRYVHTIGEVDATLDRLLEDVASAA